ncbi:MAG: tRNA pseudouridine(55) synthase TruB [Bacilli bacterium]|nr:tRNA pseudouridine(55) synthase TruB [Bacilli bacterium]
MNGILLINKPSGLSSHDVIGKLRTILNIKKIGHAGTLDPAATGLLVTLVGAATKLSPYVIDHDKEYYGEVVIGIETDTEDGEGQTIAVKEVDKELCIDDALKSLLGKQMQTPPMYSAVKQEGKKLYQLARRGIEIERLPRAIDIYCLERTTPVIYENKTARFSFFAKVSKGTYIRTLAVDIGKKLGYPAYLARLQRIAVGKYTISDAFSLEAVASGDFRLLNMLTAFKDCPIVAVSRPLADKVLTGQRLSAEELGIESDTAVISHNDNLLAIYKKKNGRYYAERVWN